MTNKNIENIVKIDTNSFADMCKQIIELEEENKSLKMDNDFLQRKLEQKERMLKGVKLNNSKLTLERNNAIDELNRIKAMNMYEFANKYNTPEQQEEAGHQLARSLGVGQ
jgi:regulator of replication initiation timing